MKFKCTIVHLISLLLLKAPRASQALSASRESSPSTPPPLKFKSTPCNRICRYNSKVHDGRVCIGCYRDEYEISSWGGLSSIEKSYVLEDAADRADELEMELEGLALDGAVSSDELRRQAFMWLKYDNNDIQFSKDENTSLSKQGNGNDGSQEVPLDADMRLQVHPPSPSKQQDAEFPQTGTSFSSTIQQHQQKKPQQHLQQNQHHQQQHDSQTHLPPTPCNRICRYNLNCFDGNVCIGCFRDSHEIEHWSSMPVDEKVFSLEDAADRCHEMTKTTTTTSQEMFLEGSISERELKRQALLWRKRKETETKTSTSVIVEPKVKAKIEAETKTWEEVDIETSEVLQTRTILLDTGEQRNISYAKFLQGESVITVSSIIPPIKCQELVRAARTAAKSHRSTRLTKRFTDNGLVRIPTVGAKIRAAKNGTPCANCLDDATDGMLVKITRNICKILDENHPSLVHSIFGTDSLLENLYVRDNLRFSSREPAVNLYTPGGQFLPHKDGQKLTILVTLSDAQSYGGGGTGFWPPDSSGYRTNPPSLVLKPSPGDMILFVGHVTHAGLPINVGERVVFVMSFSPKS